MAKETEVGLKSVLDKAAEMGQGIVELTFNGVKKTADLQTFVASGGRF